MPSAVELTREDARGVRTSELRSAVRPLLPAVCNAKSSRLQW